MRCFTWGMYLRKSRHTCTEDVIVLEMFYLRGGSLEICSTCEIYLRFDVLEMYLYYLTDVDMCETCARFPGSKGFAFVILCLTFLSWLDWMDAAFEEVPMMGKDMNKRNEKVRLVGWSHDLCWATSEYLWAVHEVQEKHWLLGVGCTSSVSNHCQLANTTKSTVDS